MTIRNAVNHACHRLMRPLARFLVRSGIGFREFAEIAKVAFVDVVSEDYGIRGRKTNISRVAVLTGLTRKEVSRIRHASRFGSVSRTTYVGRPEQILHAWSKTKEYADEAGQPRVILPEGSGATFASLSRMIGGDIPPGAMLKELVRAGSVEQLSDGRLRLLTTSFMPDSSDPESILLAGEAVHDLTNTIVNNLYALQPREKRLERRVYSEALDISDAQALKSFASEKAEILLEEIDNWIADREARTSQADNPSDQARVGLGVFVFEEEIGG